MVPPLDVVPLDACPNAHMVNVALSNESVLDAKYSKSQFLLMLIGLNCAAYFPYYNMYIIFCCHVVLTEHLYKYE